MRAGARMAALLFGLAWAGGAGATDAVAPPVLIELNRLEDQGNACRAYLVLANRGDAAVESLELDLVLFDRDGVIARRLAVQGGPLPAGRTQVRAFDVAGLGCDGLGRVLLNGIIDCGPGIDSAACRARAEIAFRTAIPFND